MIETHGIDVKISKNKIIDCVSVSVSEGEFVGIIGPNGSGKSTLLKAIYRVLKATTGSIFVDGRNIDDMNLRESALKIAVVAQHNYYNFDFSVEDVVLMGRSPHKQPMELDNAEDREITKNAIEVVGMSDFSKRNFYTLSGGEQQRVILARSLAQQTPCLLLDEPTNHLDIKYQLQILDIVKGLGHTVLCALHDLNLAAAYCDRLYLLKGGRIFVEGTPEEVLTEKNIKDVYDVDVSVSRHPVTGLLNIVYKPGFIG